jgi:hypothetical protein
MTILADDVDIAIGIDTHKRTHSAAVVAAPTGAVWPSGPLTPIRSAKRFFSMWQCRGSRKFPTVDHRNSPVAQSPVSRAEV